MSAQAIRFEHGVVSLDYPAAITIAVLLVACGVCLVPLTYWLSTWRFERRRPVGHAPQASKYPHVVWRGTDDRCREIGTARNEILDDIPWKEVE